MQGSVTCLFVFVVTSIGLIFMIAHQMALIKYRKQKDKITNRMPDFYSELHPSKGSNWDIHIFSYLFMLIIGAFAYFVFVYAKNGGGESMQGYYYCCIMRSILITVSYISIICGSIGMMVFATRFSFSSRIKDLELMPERFLGLNGYRVWWWSWFLIILGTAIQLLDFWVRCAG